MYLSELKHYRIPEQFIELWQKRQGNLLLPVQSRAVRAGLLDDPKSDAGSCRMIISAPTSSGKSFCAELAASRALARRQRVVYLLPLRSLAEEKYRLFRDTYGPLGIKCLIASSDHPENDRAFSAGDFHIALVINEKFDLALTAHLDLLANIGLVVIDEIQMISEPGRGVALEKLLTKIRASTYRPDLLALSAVLGEHDVRPLADWLGARLVQESLRPRDLLRGVAADGRFDYRSHNTERDGSAPFAGTAPVGDEESLRLLTDQICADGGATLIFVKSRADSMQLALQLAAAGFPPAGRALERLEAEEPSSLLNTLSQVLRHGVAFHNSDLSASQREAVESGFISGEIRVLCATTTLALGVNLPADTVYLETVKYASGNYGDRPELTPISRAEFDNMAGRAGRLDGVRADPGRAIILAGSEFERQVLWDNYINPSERRPLVSVLSGSDAVDWVLDMVACGLAATRDDLARLLAESFLLQAGRPADRDFDLDRAIDTLRGFGLLTVSPQSGLAPTGPGAATARTGLGVINAGRFLRTLDSDGSPETEFGWICLALSGPGWSPPPGFLSWYERSRNESVRRLYQRFDYSVEEAVRFLPEDHRRRALDYRTASALKAALVLDDWRQLLPVNRLEERYGVHLGKIQEIAGTAAHLLASLASLIKGADLDSPEVERLRQLAFAVRFGMPDSFRSWRHQFAGILTRADFGALYRAGIESFSELAAQSEDSLLRIINNKSKISQIIALQQSYEEEVDMQSTVAGCDAALSPKPQLIEIDGSFEADRYLVRINGLPVRLTGKSFKYLTKLAWSRLKDSSGWIFKEDIEIGFNQARYLYRMKNEISAGFKSDWPVVENNRLGYYRLHIDPDKIRLNFDNLKSHPDYELRCLFESGAGPVN
jgi:helicase